MPNIVLVVVVCGLWAEGVCGGAILERFTARLSHKSPRYRMGPQSAAAAEQGAGFKGGSSPGKLGYRSDKVNDRGEKDSPFHYNVGPENTRFGSSIDQRLVQYRLEEKTTTSSKYIDQRLVQFRIDNEKKRENDQKIIDYTNLDSEKLQDDLHEIVTENFESEEVTDPRVRKGQSNFRTTEYPSSRWKEPFWTVQHAGVQRELSDQPQSSCVPVAVDDTSVVRAAVILPNTSDYLTSLSSVLPVLRLAQQEVRRRQLLPSTLDFQWLPRDDRCDAVHAQIGTFEAVKQNVHVFFGPACEYSVAPVARMIKFWHTPLLTTGALTFDFSKGKRDPESEYHLLMRAGMLSFQDLAKFVIAILKRYEWKKVMLIYEKDGCRQISGKHTCKLMMETLVEFFKEKGLHYGSYDLEKNAADGLSLNLRRELGYQYNSE